MIAQRLSIWGVEHVALLPPVPADQRCGVHPDPILRRRQAGWQIRISQDVLRREWFVVDQLLKQAQRFFATGDRHG